MFRVIFATIYILKWKCRYNCSSKYKIQQKNLNDELKSIKSKSGADGESTDDEIMNEELEKLYEQNKDAISRKMDESRYIGSEYSMP